MIFRTIDEDEAYITFYPGLEYTRDAASMIVRQTDYINYKEGKLSSIIVSNPKYDKTLPGMRILMLRMHNLVSTTILFSMKQQT